MQKNIYPGKFIVFDGLDGSGQTTQSERIFNFLNEKDQKLKFGHAGAHLTKEPTPSLIGGLIRSQLSHDWKSSQECLQLLFAADRSYHLEKEIVPLLERGISVTCDRYFFSTIAFGSMGIADREWLLNLNKNFIYPDFTFLLKVSPKVCIERIHGTRYSTQLFEKEDLLIKVWSEFERLSKEFDNVYVLDGERPVEKITQEITGILTQKLK